MFLKVMFFQLLIVSSLMSECTENNYFKCIDGDCFNGQGTYCFLFKYVGQFKDGKIKR